MKQRTEAAPKVGVDKLPGPGPPVGAFPVKELVVGGVVAVQVAEVPGEQGRRPEVVDVDEGVGGGGSAVVLPTSAHYHGDNVERVGVVAEAVDEELFGDVYKKQKKLKGVFKMKNLRELTVPTVGVLKGEVKFVVTVQHCKALFRFTSRTFQLSTVPVDVHLDVL